VRKRPRYDADLEFRAVYPYRSDGTCRCGCGEEVVPPRRFWSSEDCAARAVRYFRILKGDTKVIRRALYARDRGRCASCQKRCRKREWEADHIIPVAHGGAGCELTNFQTLCRDCHRAKTNAQRLRTRRRNELARLVASSANGDTPKL
jgi:5-methylcytosine-specific restriction endonuclease McrA